MGNNNKSIIIVQGKFGVLETKIPQTIDIVQDKNVLNLVLKNKARNFQALHGLYRTLINNMIVGVSEQFHLTLILKGVGYRATVQNDQIILNLGYSHPVSLAIPESISVEISQNKNIKIIRSLKSYKIIIMKFSKQTLLKLKSKNKKLKPNKYKKLRRESVRGQIKGTLKRPRLSVYRSNENIYAQIIDDTNSKTLLTCSTLDRSIKFSFSNGRTCNTSKLMGEKLAELSLKKNIKKIVFDRGSYLYHGRIKALANGARKGGLQF